MRDSAADRGMGMKRQVISMTPAAFNTTVGNNSITTFQGNGRVMAPGKIVEVHLGANAVPTTVKRVHVFPYRLDNTLAAPDGALLATFKKGKIPVLPDFASGRLNDADSTLVGKPYKTQKIAISALPAVQGLANAGGAGSTLDLTGVAAAYAIAATNETNTGGVGVVDLDTPAFDAFGNGDIDGWLYVAKAAVSPMDRGWAALIASFLTASNAATLDRLATASIGVVASIVYSPPLNRPPGWMVGAEVEIISGLGLGQKRKVISCDPETMIITVDSAWAATEPASGSGWRIVPKTHRVNAGDSFIFDMEGMGATIGANGVFCDIVIEFDERLNDIQGHFEAI